MIEQIATFFSVEMIYLWLNIGIIPFWFILIFFPQSKICGLFVTSIIPLVILSIVFNLFDKNFISIFVSLVIMHWIIGISYYFFTKQKINKILYNNH